MVISSIFVAENAKLPIYFTLFGIVISFKLLQPENAESEIDVIVFGSVTFVKFSHIANAHAPTLVTPGSITSDLI